MFYPCSVYETCSFLEKMKVLLIAVAIVASMCSSGESTTCHRCQYITTGNTLVDSNLPEDAQDADCPNTPSAGTSVECTAAGAKCGTIKGKLKLDINFGISMTVEADVFSRDCFPDPTNSGVEQDAVVVGCHDAQEFDDFFQQGVAEGLSETPGLTLTVTVESGCVCFCDGDNCNVRTSMAGEECSGVGCQTTVCENNGVCSVDNSGVETCACQAGYSGDTCQTAPTSCYRCQHIETDSDVADQAVETGLAKLNLENQPSCSKAPPSESNISCSRPGASCGTVQARLTLKVVLNDAPTKVLMDVFSRDCFPDETNPGIRDADVKPGCYKADDFESFFDSRFLLGLQGVTNLVADLDGQEGCICFCAGDNCNDATSLDDSKCRTSGAGETFASTAVLFAAALVVAFM